LNVSQPLTKRALITVTIIVITVTSGNLWLNRGGPPLGYQTFDMFGFTFAHPQDAYVNLEGLGMTPLTNDAGVLTVSRPVSGVEQVGVIWLSTELVEGPEAALDMIFQEASGSNQVISRGEVLQSTKDGHPIYYVYFTVTDQGVDIPGIMGSWHCTEDGRIFSLYLVNLPNLDDLDVTPDEIKPKWQWYLNLIDCH